MMRTRLMACSARFRESIDSRSSHVPGLQIFPRALYHLGESPELIDGHVEGLEPDAFEGVGPFFETLQDDGEDLDGGEVAHAVIVRRKKSEYQQWNRVDGCRCCGNNH